MAHYIDTGGQFLGHLIGDGDISLVWENAPTNHNGKIKSCIGDEKSIAFIKELDLGDRLASIHVINPNPLAQGKSHAPVRDLRKRWERVLLELPETTKRIILFAPDANILKSVIARPLSSIPGFGFDTAHGTIFTLPNGVELVPTWDKVSPYQKKFRDRDIDRAKNLVKPKEPLPYQNYLPAPQHILTKDIVIDVETTGGNIHTDTLTSIGIQWGPNSRAILVGDEGRFIDIGLWLLERASEGCQFWFHNAAFDLAFLPSQLRTDFYSSIHDTLMRSRAGGCLDNSLKHLGNYYTDRPGNYAWLEGHHNFSDPAYQCEDLEVTWQLKEKWKKFQPPIVILAEYCQSMLVDQSLTGSKIDRPKLAKVDEELPAHIAELREEITKQFADPEDKEAFGKALRKAGYAVGKTATGQYSIKKQDLRDWGLEDCAQYIEAKKLLSSFVNTINGLILDNDILPHTQSMLICRSGRTSMKDYNWQQTGRKGPIRQLLISRFENGYIGSVDLSQAELRVAALISNDEPFAKVLMSRDAHQYNASMAFNVPIDQVTDEQRTDAKTVVFRALYGGQPQNEGQQQVKNYLDREFEDLAEWSHNIKKEAASKLKIVDIWGKVTNLEDLYNPEYRYNGIGRVKRTGLNGPIQGIASHTSMYIQFYCWKYFKKRKLQSLVLFGNHDATLMDIHPYEVGAVCEIVQESFWSLEKTPIAKFPLFNNPLPITGELLIGKNWSLLKMPKPGKESTLSFEPLICSSLR